MRIAVINFSSRRVGGTEAYLEEIIAQFANSGHEVALFTEYDLPANRPAIRLPDQSPEWSVAKQGRRHAITSLSDWKPDLIYSHGLVHPGIEAATLDVAPAVFFVHGYYGTCITGAKTNSYPQPVPCTRNFGPKCLLHFYPKRCGGLNPFRAIWEYRRQAARFKLLRRYQVLITASTHMREEYLRHGFDPELIFMSTYLIDAHPPQFKRIETAGHDAAGNKSADAVRLLYLGRMDALKGGILLLDSLPIVADALGRSIELTLGGDGFARRSWVRHARAISAKDGRLKTTFTGWLDRERIERLQLTSDLLVVPSLWPEPFGRVGPESGLYGLPAVAFAVGGIPDWLHDGVNGYLAPPDPPTPHGLAEAMIKCLRDPAEHARLRLGAATVASRFNLRTHMSQLYGVFDAVLTQNAAPERAMAARF